MLSYELSKGHSTDRSCRECSRSTVQSCGATCQPPQPNMDGTHLAQWLSVQVGNMADDLQHNVRTLLLRASFPMPVLDGRDEVASLRKQLRHQQQTHRVMQTMLKNQALAIETFQGKWQMAGLSLVNKFMHLLPRLVHCERTLYGPNSWLFKDSKIVFSVNMMVNFVHMFMPYKTKGETMSDRRRINCARGSSMPLLKNPACVEISGIKP